MAFRAVDPTLPSASEDDPGPPLSHNTTGASVALISDRVVWVKI